jgi:hypothetical protein
MKKLKEPNPRDYETLEEYQEALDEFYEAQDDYCERYLEKRRGL